MNKIIYMDAAASALKPKSVIAAQTDFLQNHYANAGRGVCARATAATEMVDSARDAVAKFIGAAPDQIVFTSGTTDGINRIANMLSGAGRIAVSDLDHHSARLPFEHKFKTMLMPLDSDFNIGAVAADVMVITAMSNVLGTPQDIKSIVAAAKKLNPDVITVVDAAQYAAHLPIDVADWDCDALCFSGHKIGADTGLGIMYLKNSDIWNTDKFGGGTGWMTDDGIWMMSDSVARFEAGTLPLTQIAGLIPAIENIKSVIHHPSFIIHYLHGQLSKNPRIKIITKPDAHLLSFTVDDMHVLDFGALIGARDVCVRVGNMCASWIHKLLGVPGTIRISPGFWNTLDDAQKVVDIIKQIVK